MIVKVSCNYIKYFFIEEILYRVKRRIKNKTRLSVTDYLVQCKNN